MTVDEDQKNNSHDENTQETKQETEQPVQEEPSTDHEPQETPIINPKFHVRSLREVHPQLYVPQSHAGIQGLNDPSVDQTTLKHHDDHHHHLDEHHEEEPGQKFIWDRPFYETRLQKQLDFEHRHPSFQLHITKKGPQFSEIDEKRLRYVAQHAGKTYTHPMIHIPPNIPGLAPLKGPLPANRKWWEPISSFERNGQFNIFTPNFLKVAAVPAFALFFLNFWWGHQSTHYYFATHEDNMESPLFYDKLNDRLLPSSRLSTRPG